MRKKISGPRNVTSEFYQTSKEKLAPAPLKLSTKLQEEGTLPTSVSEASTAGHQSQTDTTREKNWGPISLMDTNVRIFNSELNPAAYEPRSVGIHA